MARTTITSRELNQNVSAAKRAAKDGPVFITDRGKAGYVLMKMDAYHALEGNERRGTIVDLLAMPEEYADIPFDPPRFDSTFRPVDFDE